MPAAKKEAQQKSPSSNLEQQISELIASIGKMTQRVDKLVSLFEEAAKHVGEVESTEARITSLSTKLESLLDQNKAIAQGLILLEKYVRGKSGLEAAQISEYQ